jgi:hypothetical protein
VKRYGADAWQKAKDAGKTKLNERQFYQVRTPAFKEWFGDWENDKENASKVVDHETGEPMVVFHGTNSVFSSFSKDKLGSATGAPSSKLGFFFASNQDVASSYAKTESGYQNVPFLNLLNKLTNGLYERANEKILKVFNQSLTPNNANVIAGYMSLQDPLIINLNGKEYRDKSYFDIITEAKKNNNDGIIIKNTFDPGFNETGAEVRNGLTNI